MRQTRVRFIPSVVQAPTPPIKDAMAPLPVEEYDEPVRTEPKRRAGERLQAMAEMAEKAKKYNSTNVSKRPAPSDCGKSCKHCGGVQTKTNKKKKAQTPPESDSDSEDDGDDKLNAILKKLKLSGSSRN